MKKIEFDTPVTLDGKKVKEMKLREPLFKDIRLVNKTSDELEAQNQLIRRLSGMDAITNEEFDNMPYKEYKKIAKVIEDFL